MSSVGGVCVWCECVVSEVCGVYVDFAVLGSGGCVEDTLLLLAPDSLYIGVCILSILFPGTSTFFDSKFSIICFILLSFNFLIFGWEGVVLFGISLTCGYGCALFFQKNLQPCSIPEVCSLPELNSPITTSLVPGPPTVCQEARGCSSCTYGTPPTLVTVSLSPTGVTGVLA